MPGGKIIVPDTVRDKLALNQMFISAVGLPEFCDDDECPRAHGFDSTADPWQRLHLTDERIQAGAWCVVQPRSLVDAGSDTEKLYFVRIDQIEGVITEDRPKD